MSSLPPPSPQNEWQRYGRWFAFTVLGAAVASILLLGSAYVQAGTYSDWAVLVVAGDWHAHDGSPSEIFDNARRDMSAALVSAGFNPANLVQFSVRPERYPTTHPLESDAATIADTLSDLAVHARGGCVLYFSSHGAPSGLVLGDRILTPARLDNIVSASCGERPTVVVVSSCYSGVFINALARPNRMIVTAARRDRTSFGCGGTNRYPYFDACFLAAMNRANDFRTAAVDADRCVARLERQTRMSPPSDPQIFIGRQIAARLPAWC
jgi:hypothetical protein